MLAQFVSDSLRRRGIHYAWVVAGVTFLAMLVTSAALGLPGAMLRPLSGEFGWSTRELSSVFAVRFALYGLLGPFAALLIGQYGLRRIMMTATIWIAAAMLLATAVRQLWQLAILWGLLLGCATGLTALVLGAMVANRWFTARRGLVVGILAASTATGQLIFLPLAAWLIERYGWRYAVLPVSAGCFVVAALTALFMRDRPEDVGLRPYDEPAAGDPAAGEPAAGDPAGAAERTTPIHLPGRVPGQARGHVPLDLSGPLRGLGEGLRNRTFWILAGTFFICGLSTNGLIQTHFIALCGDRGLATVPAASVLSMMGAFDLIGTTLSGYLSDRWDNRKLLFWYYGLRGLSLMWLPYSTFTFYGLIVFAMFYGLDWIATVPPTVKLCGREFGKERAALFFGWIFAAHQLGAAAAAYGAGLTRTLLLTYTPALMAAGGACLFAAAAVSWIRPPSARALIPKGQSTAEIGAVGRP